MTQWQCVILNAFYHQTLLWMQNVVRHGMLELMLKLDYFHWETCSSGNSQWCQCKVFSFLSILLEEGNNNNRTITPLFNLQHSLVVVQNFLHRCIKECDFWICLRSTFCPPKYSMNAISWHYLFNIQHQLLWLVPISSNNGCQEQPYLLASVPGVVSE